MLENHMVIGNQNAHLDGPDSWLQDLTKRSIANDHDIEAATEYCAVVFDKEICDSLEEIVFANLASCSRDEMTKWIVGFRKVYFNKIGGYLDHMVDKELNGEI